MKMEAELLLDWHLPGKEEGNPPLQRSGKSISTSGTG